MKRVSFMLLIVVGLLVPLLKAAVPGDIGGRVVFVSNRSGYPNLWLLDMKTQAVKQITDFTGGDVGDRSILWYPKWSPDGKWIAFGYQTDVDDPNSMDVYVINDTGSILRRITNNPGSWSAYISNWDPNDPDVLYYILFQPYSGTIHRVNINTLVDVEIPNMFGSHTQSFALTQDGNEVLFSREPQCCNAYSIFIGYQDPQGAYGRIIKGQAPATYVWSINRIDDWILCLDPHNINKFDKDGGPPVLLTWGQETACPVWTSGDNNGYIIFQIGAWGSADIAMMKADGASYPNGVTYLSNDQSNDYYPDWTPFKKAYIFNGFDNPLENPPTVNGVKAGQALPLKWKLMDELGAPISNPMSLKGVTSLRVDCDFFVGDPVEVIEEPETGDSGLQYLGDGWWQYNWKTSKSYAGQCRVVKVALDDDSVHVAHISFR